MSSSPLTPDIRTRRSEISFSGRMIPYSVLYSKNQQRSVIIREQDGSLYVKVKTGTSDELIRILLHEYLKNNDYYTKSEIKENPEVINIKGLNIPYSVRINNRRKYPGFTMFKDGRLVVEIPKPLLPDKITELIKSEENWIYREYYKTLPECPPDDEIIYISIISKEIPLHIRRSTRAKRLILKIIRNGCIEVIAPFDTDNEEIRVFVHKNKDWIASKTGITRNISEPDKPLSKNPARNKKEDESGSVECNDQTINYTIRRSRRAKSVIIKIDPDHRVVVVAPENIPASKIHTFTSGKAEWIYNHTKGSDRPQAPVRRYCDGEIWPWYGKNIKLRILSGTKPWAEVKGEELFVTIPPDVTPAIRSLLIRKILIQFFKISLHEYTIPFVMRFAGKFSVPVPVVKIHGQETKWGACTSRSVIFNLKLCMAPPDIIEYVVAHELCHLVHPDHSQRFWGALREVMPDYQERRVYLKKNGYLWRM